jgi:general secretion pathway protein D
MRIVLARLLPDWGNISSRKYPRNHYRQFAVTMKSPLLTAMIAACVAVGVSASLGQQIGVQSVAEREIRRQESMADYAEKAINKGTEAMMNQDYESAFSYFKSAVDVLPSGGTATLSVRETALDGFSRAAIKLTEQRISEGRYQDATTTIRVILEERYAPDYGPALALQRKLKDPDRFNRAYTPGFIANVEEVKQLLLEADGFYGSGRFDLAFKRYEQVLNIDKYNIAARRGMERVNLARQRYATNAYNEARGDMLTQVDKSWELPVRRFEVGASTIIEQPQIDTRGTSLINRKLDEIIIPRVDFRDATIREALDFLKQRSVALDTTDQDPTRRGINIVLKVPADSPEADARITLSLNDIPLRAAIDYVAKAANLKLKIEPYAVAVVPQSEPTDVLITKEYKVPPGFITSLPATGQPPLPGPGGQTIAPGSQPAIQARSGAREFLEAQGVTFPPGASANFIASTSKLIIKNTQANLDLIDTLVETQMTAPPSQVEIESKFLEVSQNNLKEMGFDWLLGQFGLPFGTGVFGGGGTQGIAPQGLAPNINANSFPFLNPGSTTVPIGATSATSGPITAGNRSGTTAISVNAVDSLLFATPFGPAPALLSVAGIFTNPQFQVVLRALNQQKGVDLVSAPKVTTKSGQRATIQIVREFRYPTEYDLPQVTQTPGSIYTPATPTTPTSFETKPVGITLEVEPTVGPDGYTIDLILSPRVVEFDGFINYGSPINTVVTLVPGTINSTIIPPLSTSFVVTQNIINKPVFSTREVTTEVTVYDGQTVVIGGLISENIQKIEDKVPILGDIPLAGRLFRTTADQHIKRNLIMFVTASLLDPAGQPLIKFDEEAEIMPEPSASAVEEEIIPGDAMTIPQPQ